MKTYYTSQIANKLGLHPNTIRLYESWGYISQATRQKNGYRIFTDVHLEQMRLCRIALRGEVLQNGLRKHAIKIIKTAANGAYESAVRLTHHYLSQIAEEKRFAEETIYIVQHLFSSLTQTDKKIQLTRKQAATYLGITIDTLRNWELNGLLTVKRRQNNYRVYTNKELTRLMIIRCLRCANYSLSAILRMMHDVMQFPDTDLRTSLNTPKETEEIVSVCDMLLTSLAKLETDANEMLIQLAHIQKIL